MRRPDSTFLRRLTAWRSQAQNVFVQGVAAEVDPSRMHWKRRRIGRPPRRWEAPLVEAFGRDWFRMNHLDAVYLGQVVGVELPEHPGPCLSPPLSRLRPLSDGPSAAPFSLSSFSLPLAASCGIPPSSIFLLLPDGEGPAGGSIMAMDAVKVKVKVHPCRRARHQTTYSIAAACRESAITSG